MSTTTYTPEQLAAMHEACRQLVLFTMAAEHLRGGDGFVPAHELERMSMQAREAFTDDELQDMVLDVAEFNEHDIFEPPCDLAVRVMRSGTGNYRWMLMRSLGDHSYAEYRVGDEQFADYAGAFRAGTAALEQEGRFRGEQAVEAANEAWRPQVRIA